MSTLVGDERLGELLWKEAVFDQLKTDSPELVKVVEGLVPHIHDLWRKFAEEHRRP